jgi:aspartate/methionine/tyrosine aminotransferase
MVMKVSSRGDVPPFIVMDVMKAAADRAAEGGDVLHLEVGQPATGAPRGVLEAAKHALDTDKLGYTLAFGLPRLRERLAEHYRAWYDVDLPIERIAVTTGSSAGFLLSFLAAFDPGDRVAMVSPGYPAYRNILTALGIEPVLMLAGPEHRFQPTPALLDALDEPVNGLILASPSNPTGTMVDREGMKALTDYCLAKDIRLISDEIYHGIGYGKSWVSALESDPNALIINSFSKYFSMTGWRLGWMVVPPDMVHAIECLAPNMFISSPSLSQHAAISAFDCHDELQNNVKHYARNRDILLNELPGAGFSDLAPPDGAFYVYANVADITNDSVDFCRRMLADTGVACTPGLDFDPDRGNATIRFSFAGSTDDMIDACRRMKSWIKR